MSWGVEMLDVPERIGFAVTNSGVDLISGLFDNEAGIVAAVPASAFLWNASTYTFFPASFPSVRGRTPSMAIMTPMNFRKGYGKKMWFLRTKA